MVSARHSRNENIVIKAITAALKKDKFISINDIAFRTKTTPKQVSYFATKNGFKIDVRNEMGGAFNTSRVITT